MPQQQAELIAQVVPAPHPPPPPEAFNFPVVPTLTFVGGIAGTFVLRSFVELLRGKWADLDERVEKNAAEIAALKAQLAALNTDMRVSMAQTKARLDSLFAAVHQIRDGLFDTED